jgi:hypothetical protein
MIADQAVRQLKQCVCTLLTRRESDGSEPERVESVNLFAYVTVMRDGVIRKSWNWLLDRASSAGSKEQFVAQFEKHQVLPRLWDNVPSF